MQQQYVFDVENKKKYPTIIFGDRVFTVNNSTKNVQNFTKLVKEFENKNISNLEQSQITLEHFLGKEAAQIVEDADLPIPAYSEFVELVVSALQQVSVDEFKEKKGK